MTENAGMTSLLYRTILNCGSEADVEALFADLCTFQEVEQMAQRELTAQEAGEAARFLLQLGWEERYHSLTQPMREAVQGHVRPLVPFLAAEEAGELAAWYAQVYPRRRRLPVQSQLLKALERRSREN